ncbi:NAD-dependent epimerase/dehydratase family protein [Desulfofundulus thermobenzoicus]|uniref:NAD-dependent epimerase/dehydratase family protein n=1 Tax=Desulfofundulus thermobenzoicus TaxID=29376 RepID=A0A6N7IRQ6_9FIRM|nr:GDP-mannose 4,6-dehydratase [Desulfofundulus thermobenzoicus]MQL52253.1 NAD-dependent epimerase/dehydratase family protein [Desulfofundulus thermobenzoicus]
MRILITGAGGFVGYHLAACLRSRGHIVYAGVRRTKPEFPPGVQPVQLDVLNSDILQDIVSFIRPEAVVHLAAQSMVSVSWREPAQTFAINVLGTINLVEAIAQTVPECKIITVGSGEEYGLTATEGSLLTEDHPCRPYNPYALSKFAMGQVALQIARRHGLRVIHVRPFNHFGPGQQEGYVVSDFAAQIARIKAGLQQPVLRVGDLSPCRDFIDVRDVVEAYAALLEYGMEGEIYNVCSGVARSIREVLDLLLEEARVPVKVEIDPARIRPAEIPVFVGSADKLSGATGWRPQRDFAVSLRETLDWWRRKTQEGPK